MGKRIEDLLIYGAVNSAKIAGDIYEVSKNSGTSGSPVYLPGDSHKIRLDELAILIGKTLPGGYIPLAGPNYLVVTNSGTPIENGTDLLEAIIYAQNTTPNGAALSASNRFTLLLYPGIYDLDTDTTSELGQFVDIVGVGSAEEIIITSANATATIKIANTNDYILRNLTLKNTNDGCSIYHNAAQTDLGFWRDLILYAPNVENTIWGGVYEYVQGKVDNILNGSITGEVDFCSFQYYSCGRSASSDILISGKIKNSTAGNFSFGNGVNVTISGILYKLESGNNSMGCSNVSGTVNFTSSCVITLCEGTGNNFGRTDGDITIDCKITHCKSASGSWASSVSGNCTIGVNAYFFNCKATSNSFCHGISGNMVISGKIIDCEGTTGCFGSSLDGDVTVSASAIIKQCTFSNYSCGYSSNGILIFEDGSLIDDCKTSGFLCYGISESASMQLSGLIRKCLIGNNSLGSTTATGKVSLCTKVSTDETSSGVHKGTIEYCDIIVDDDGNAALKLSDDAIVRYCTIIQDGAGDCIHGTGTNATITYCKMNKALVNVTNVIAPAYNIGDGFIMTSFFMKSDNYTWEITIDDTGVFQKNII